MHYDIDGNEISIVECSHCGNQLGFLGIPRLINGNHADDELSLKMPIVNELQLISKGMDEVCCKSPSYYYRTD